MTSHRAVTWPKAAYGLLAITIFSLAYLGGIPPLAVLLVGAGALVVTVLELRPGLRREPTHPLVWWWLAVAFVIGLQVVPLPLSFLKLISPATALLWEEAQAQVGRVALATVSLAPSQTHLELLKVASYAAVVALAAEVKVRRGPAPLIALVFALGLGNSLVGVVHAALGANKLFGVYEPQAKEAAFWLSCLINPNNFSGLCLLAGFCGLSLSRRVESPRRLLLQGLSAWLFACAVLAGSRAGTIAVLLGVSISALRLFNKRRLPLSMTTLFALTVVGVFLIGKVDNTWGMLTQKDLVKLQVFRQSWRLILDFPLTGVGRGGFETAFFSYRPTGFLNLNFTHVENVFLQYLADFGLPLGLVLILSLAVLVYRSRTVQFPGSFYLRLGLACWLFQNCFDLATELPALASLVSVLLVVLIKPRARRGHVVVWHSRLAPAATVFFLLTSSALVLSVNPKLNSLHEERELAINAVAEAVSSQADVTRVSALLKDLRLAYPADPFFPQVMGELLAARSPREALPWLGTSLRLCPTCAQAYLVAARLLGRAHEDQAVNLLNRALSLDGRLAHQAVMLARPIISDENRWLRVLPPQPAPYLAQEICLASTDLQVCERVAHRVLEKNPDDYQLNYFVITRKLARVGTPADVKALDGQIAQLSQHPQGKSLAVLARAQLLNQQKHYAQALTLLMKECPAMQAELQTCLQLLPGTAGAAAQTGQTSWSALESVGQLGAVHCDTNERCAAIYLAVSNQYLSAGHTLLSSDWSLKAAGSTPSAEVLKLARDRAKTANRMSIARNLQDKLDLLKQ